MYTETQMTAAWQGLLNELRPLGSVMISFSGGADSSLLLAAAVEALGPDKVVAAIAAGPFTPPWDFKAARELAQELDVELVEVKAGEMNDPEIVANDPLRCYRCKKRRLMLLTHLCQERELGAVAEGSQADDASQDRPGARAIAELGAKSPLMAAGLGKDMVRALGRELEIPAAIAPSSACLATRIPTGTPLSIPALERVTQAELAVRALYPGQVRVRDHFPHAKLVLDELGIIRIGEAGFADQLRQAVQKAGYASVCLDLSPYGT